MSVSNIINRREIEPLLFKAQEVIRTYEMATGVSVFVMDKTGCIMSGPDREKTSAFCKLCKTGKAAPDTDLNPEPHPCSLMHINGMNEAQRCGGTYIYICDMGFTYWCCPLFSNGRSSGALIAGGVLSVEREKVIERIKARGEDGPGVEEAEEILAGISELTHEDITAMAQLLLLCAEHISRGSEDYQETAKRQAEQQSYLSKQISRLKAKHSPPGYPLDKERMLLAALRRGDSDTGRGILNELLEILHVSNPNNFKFMQLRAIELVVLLSRAAVTPDTSEDDLMLETNNRYLRRIQDAKNIEELTDILHIIVDRMSGQIFSFQGVRHASALRKAERFIWENYTRKISLQEIAGASGLSAPYFSTIFKEEMGENLSSYLNRLRVEKAATMLTESDLPLSEIAGSCGFEDQSWFSKIFKNFMGMSPGKYREQGNGMVLKNPTDILTPTGF
jgi:AraC-like DNA-binding protein/ligand-binding sensor protein